MNWSPAPVSAPKRATRIIIYSVCGCLFFLFIFLQGPPGINNGIDTSHPFASGKAENLLSRLLSSRTAPRGPARPRRHPESVNWGKKSPH